MAEGFRVEAVLRGLTYPSSVEIDDDGNLWVAEAGYSYGDPTATPRIFCVSPAGAVRIAAQQGLHGPVTDLLWHDGRLFVSHRGSIATLGEDGSVREVVGGLPSDGDHQNNQLTAGADGWLYFGQGTATNSGVVGPDNARMGWLRQHPELHDVPARDVRLAEGAAFESANPLTADESDTVTTAAFHAFGETAGEDAAVRGATKANGAILRVRPDGSGLEVFAWGLRNPFGVAWSPDRVLFATENGFDARGSRPIANDQEDVYVIEQGAFYGWPDFASGVPVTDARFRPEGEEQPEFLLREHPEVASPWLSFPKHAAICKLDFASSDAFGKGRMFVAFFGHMTPMTGEAPQQHGGHRVVAIDVRSRQVEAFLVRAHHDDEEHGKDDARGDLQRPVDVRFAPDGRALYVVDFGELHMRDGKPHPVPGTGVVWRIQPAGDDPVAPPAGLRAPH